MITLHLFFALGLSVPAWLIVAYLLIDELLEQYSSKRLIQSQVPAHTRICYFKPVGYDKQYDVLVFNVAVSPVKQRII